MGVGALALMLMLMLAAVPLQTSMLLGGDFTEYFRHESPAGQVPYLAAKLCALYAIELVWLQALLGLWRHRIVATGFVSGAAWRNTHRALGLATLTMIVAHVALFVTATSMRNRSPAFDLLLPWGHGVYRTWVAVGAAAFLLILLAAGAQLLLRSHANLRLRLHRLVLLAMVLVAIHSLTIGSESRSGWVAWMYAVMALSLGAALLDRYVLSRGRSIKQQAL